MVLCHGSVNVMLGFLLVWGRRPQEVSSRNETADQLRRHTHDVDFGRNASALRFA